jgi:hypothetical protein
VHLRIAVDLAGRRLEHAGAHLPAKRQHVDRAQHRGLHGLDRVELVVDRGGWTREVVDLIDLEQDRLDYIMPNDLEVAAIHQVADVLPAPGEEVVEAQHLMPVGEQSLAKVRADETCSAGYQDPHVVLTSV